MTIAKRDEKKLKTAAAAGLLTWISGGMTLFDTAWGVLASLGLDLSRTNELVLAISFVLGFPAFLLDRWIKRRIVVAMVGIILFRWAAVCFAGPAPVLVSPWRNNILLVVASALLQLALVRREEESGAPTG